MNAEHKGRVHLSYPLRLPIEDVQGFVKEQADHLYSSRLFIPMGHPHSVGTEVTLELLLVHLGKALRVRGEVVRSIPRTRDRQEGAGMLIQLRDIGLEAERIVRRFTRKSHMEPSHHGDPLPAAPLPGDNGDEDLDLSGYETQVVEKGSRSPLSRAGACMGGRSAGVDGE